MINMLVSATTALMTAVSPMNSYTIIEDCCNLPLLNPDLANRKTLKLKLANGLEALIISDENADQSAASVRVGSGSWNDPLEYPGMAHFCEHMLFMGTQKYPSDNEFFTYVSNYAGTTNAFTAPNRTMYMFAAQTTGFLPLLDRFAHFFIDPLFNPANIARELHAVDQEFAKNIENDSWREYMVFKETGNNEHPNRLFSTGNSETLGKIPQSALKKWHEENYSAEKMHLVIYSALPIETLKEAVVQIFSEVPQSSAHAIDTSASLSSPEQIGSMTFVKPIQNRQTLTLAWELPPNLSNDPTKSAQLVAYALKRGQKYSLYEKLKEEQLIDTMSVRVDELGGLDHQFFQITLELTRKGIDQMNSVILRCFEAIAGLKETGVPGYLFNEKNAMAKLDYQYQERQDPFEYIMKLGDSIAEEELNTFPRNSLLATQYNPEKINAVINTLVPETMSISLLASPEVTQVPPDRREKWFGAEYAIRPIPEKWMQDWASAKVNDHIRLAPPNPFIPENLALAPPPENNKAVPEMIADHELGLAYYVRMPEFAVPESIYYLHILSPEIQPGPRSAVLTALYLDHITDVLHPTLAAANSAGLSCSIDMDRCSLRLQIAGYSEKAPLLLEQVAKELPENFATPEQFAIYVDRHEKAYLNAQKELAARQAKELLDSIVREDKTTHKEKLAALKSITYDDFITFHKQLFETTYLKGLFAGNLTLKEAESAWLDVVHVLGKSPYPKEEQTQIKVLHLPKTGGPYEISQKADVQGNSTLLLIEQGEFTYEKRAAQEVLASILKEAFFNELRSKQKTGYIAQSDATEIEEQLYQYFIVQSNSHQPDDLLARFEQFIEEFCDSITENISVERFETLKTSLISSLQTRFRNQKEKTALWDRLAFEKDGDFDFVQKRIDSLAKLTYQEFKEHAIRFLSRTNRKRLAILMEGKLATPFAYQPIEVLQIGEIATYEPRMEKKAVAENTAGVN